MINKHFEVQIYYSVKDRECIAVMDEMKVTTGLYSGTRFAVVMDRSGGHDFIHESRFNGMISIERFTAVDAHYIRRLLLELSFVPDMKDKKRFVKGYQLLSI